jgi:2-polyprenyl-3-methyl-5-hydroxy-6-metoxy-1,4-benzoquinol methylase
MIHLHPESAAASQRQTDAYFTAQAHFWKNLYEEISLYGTIHQERRAIALGWITEVALPQAAHILEVGCGAGLLAAELARRGYIVTAIDSSEGMVERARSHAAEAGVEERLTVSVQDAHALPFATASYDLVIALGVIPWLHSPEAALTEMARVVKPDGFVIFNSDNRFRLNHVFDPWFTPVLAPVKRVVKRIALKLGYSERGAPNHYYSYATVERLLADVGLTVTRCMNLGFGPFSLFGRHLLPEAMSVRLHRRLQDLADRGAPVLRSTGAQHLILASRSEVGPAQAVRQGAGGLRSCRPAPAGSRDLPACS